MNILNSILRRPENIEVPSAQPSPAASARQLWAAVSRRGEMHEEHISPPEGQQASPQRFIARQAIFDRQRRVFGYELLCRSGWENRFTGDSDAATRMMIADGALHGFQDLTRGARSFVNCTRESLVDGLVTVLPKSTVLEILETVEPDQAVVDACRGLKQLGYEIALDDFRIRASMDPLADMANYVKVDFRLSDQAERATIFSFMKGRGARMIAEKVETQEEFQAALEEGFELFQGYFFCRPTVFAKKRTPTNGANYLRLLSALSNETFDVTQITALVKSEVTICYQLLRLVNSAAFGMAHQVRSIQDAVVLVGEDQFRKLVLNAIATETCRKHPDELLLHVLQRARFLEMLAPYTGENATEQYLFGLLSLMDVMLDVPVESLVEVLPLRSETKIALLGGTNQITTALRLLECYEQGEWALCVEQAGLLQLSESDLGTIYERSLQWAVNAADAEQGSERRPS